MTKYHNRKRQVHLNKDFPSCMGGILNLFDFNQAHSGRKLLTDTRHADGLEAPRNSLDVSLETPQGREVKNEDIPYAYEMTVPTRKKKAGGMPMRTLIAQEMSRELESKHRTPSVVARLMGLDAFPGESMLVQHIKAAEIHPQKNMPGKQQQQPKSIRDVRFFRKKFKIPTSKPMHEPPLSKPHQQAMDHSDEKVSLGTLPFRDHPQEQQLQQFKKDFEAWQASKTQDHSKAVQPDECNIQLAKKQILVREKLNEEKLALVREKFIDAKRLVADEKLQQSKEFLDALEILQSNKDLFVKFLQEPNSLFAKPLQDTQSTLQLPSQEKQLPKTKSSSIVKTNELSKEKSNSFGRHSKEQKKTEKCLHKQTGSRVFVEREEAQRGKASSPDKLVSMCSMHDSYKQYPATSSDGKKNTSLLPARIVILKPGPGRPQNFRPSPSPSCSPQSQTAFRDPGEGDRSNTEYFLQEVRERLKLEIKEKRKEGSGISKDDAQDRFCEVPRDPRQIARQIAREVRENVTRDLANDPFSLRVPSTLTVSSGKKSLLSRSAHSCGDVGVSSHMEISTSVAHHSWDHRNRFSPASSSSVGRPPDSTANVNREVRKFVSERLRFTQGNEEEQKLRQISNTSSKILVFAENKKQVPQSKSSQQNNKGSVGVEEDQVLPCNMHELDSKIKRPVRDEMPAECEGSLCDTNGDDNRDISPRNRLRSRSVPVSASTCDGGIVEKQNKASGVNTSKVPEIVLYRSASNISAGLVKSKSERSIFKGKVSSLKGSFLMKGRRLGSKKPDSLPTMQPNNYLEIHLDKDGCDLVQEMPVESDQCKEGSEDLPVLAQQEMCKQLADAPDMATEPVDYPECSTHGASPIDYKSSELAVREASNFVLVSGESEAKPSAIQVGCMIETILPGQQMSCSPLPCSPEKKQIVNEHSTSENKNEKGEQPSPVSVLDLPIQEETPSPKEFKEISSNLQELRLRLRLLKFDGFERPRHESGNLTQDGCLAVEDHAIEEADIISEKTCNSPSEAEISPVLGLSFSAIENMNIESALLNDLPCLKEKQMDLLYIMNVLVASGFTGNCDAVFAQWHSPSHPLDPCLFEKIEDSYRNDLQCQTKVTDNELCQTGSAGGREAPRSKSERCLLFDCINEVLLEILGPFFNQRPWVRPMKNNLRPMPSGKQLLEETWRTIYNYLCPQPDIQYTLEKIIAMDLAREGLWMEMQDHVEIIGIEVERLIFSDLIEEIFNDIVLRE